MAASAAAAETRTTPKAAPRAATAPADICAPIGRTAKGELVYSMKCQDVPVAAAPEAESRAAAPPPEPEVQRSGLFGWSYDRRKQGD
ncbi:hypothetical protein [Bradyrhizobium embrapense]|uniref:hypothetical protein n=1 Tax=Bradyrhizobium embrapense TaxID=630921 RepID=UPI001FCCEC59|nr:hypothetical protein [Bradyrhizobium embrapense]